MCKWSSMALLSLDWISKISPDIDVCDTTVQCALAGADSSFLVSKLLVGHSFQSRTLPPLIYYPSSYFSDRDLWRRSCTVQGVSRARGRSVYETQSSWISFYWWERRQVAKGGTSINALIQEYCSRQFLRMISTEAILAKTSPLKAVSSNSPCGLGAKSRCLPQRTTTLHEHTKVLYVDSLFVALDNFASFLLLKHNRCFFLVISPWSPRWLCCNAIFQAVMMLTSAIAHLVPFQLSVESTCRFCLENSPTITGEMYQNQTSSAYYDAFGSKSWMTDCRFRGLKTNISGGNHARSCFIAVYTWLAYRPGYIGAKAPSIVLQQSLRQVSAP